MHNLRGCFEHWGLIRIDMYCLCDKYSWREDQLRKLEIAMRIFLFVAFVWGMITIPFELFNPTEFFCWIQVYPINCDVDDEIDCIRGSAIKIFKTVGRCEA